MLLRHQTPFCAIRGIQLPDLQNLIPCAEAEELVALGFVFGDILSRELGLRWVVVDDEYGTDFGLKLPEAKVFLFPGDMLIKRVEQGEDQANIDLSYLLRELRGHVERLAQTAAR